MAEQRVKKVNSTLKTQKSSQPIQRELKKEPFPTTIEHILQLQRSIGNQAVQRLLTKLIPSEATAKQTLSHTLAHLTPGTPNSVTRRIQRSPVEVAISSGKFITDVQTTPISDVSKGAGDLIYAPMKGPFNPDKKSDGDQIGAIMKLRFKPDNSLKKPDVKVSLVQTVKDTLKVDGAAKDRPAAGFGLRSTRSGAVIDQTLYPDKPKFGDKKQKNNNLDPRYTETRTSDTAGLSKYSGSSLGTTGWSVEGNDTPNWANGAMLRDNPGAIVKPGQALSGGMQFEVAANIKTKDKEYFGGSVKWGWEVSGTDGLTPVINPTTLEIASQGEATDELFEAADAWNKMEVPETLLDFDPATGKKNKPIQLPGKQT